ncbi:hypothetical protein [uncultured Psychrobacter sp.]|uniref:hypothetical protein n=1 Tax=uncultured Psychrobacter sp. TaxID=259303 RepID=UPI003458D749
MGIIGVILFFIGLVICLIYGVKLIIIAFRESILWGLLYLFLPFANIYYIITRWEKCKGPFLKTLIGVVLLFVGTMMAPMQSAVGY